VSRAGMTERADAVAFVDEDGAEVVLDRGEAESLWEITDALDGATVSACPACRSRVVACVALVDVLDRAPAHPRSNELIELADNAPTSHLYVQDLASPCSHHRWLDPGYTEWAEVLEQFDEGRRPVS
jgi:hypothetical protein